MRRRDKPNEPDEPLLFDLPLSGPEETSAEPPRRPARSSAPPPAPPELPRPPSPEPLLARRTGPVPVPRSGPREEPVPAPASEFASRGRRFAAGAADLLVHAAVGVVALLGTRWMGVKLDLSEAPALGVLLLSFSFLYTVLPLAFWGHTLGMAWAGITSRNRDGEPLTFDQTARRWLGGVLTLLTLGLPLLVSGAHRSLTDLLSGSATYPVEET
ncbi:MAG TPA: RDD family protein [Thermoanaerobaculia bacterium]|jgi:uncharacterized RDD family membrane protein YckC